MPENSRRKIRLCELTFWMRAGWRGPECFSRPTPKWVHLEVIGAVTHIERAGTAESGYRGVIRPPSLSCSPEAGRGKRVAYASAYFNPEPVL